MKEAPLFIQCQALARWLLENLRAHPVLMDTIHRGSLRLLDDVVLALKDFDREEHLRSADATAVLLRVHLRLARDLGALEERQLVFVLGELDGIGRQLGGWQRRLDEGTMAPRHR